MSIAIAAQTTAGGTLSLAVCPNWQGGACACQKDAQGNPALPHPTFHFALEPPRTSAADVTAWNEAHAATPAPAPPGPPGYDRRVAMTSAVQFTADSWAQQCAQEALRLVTAAQAPPPAPAQAPASTVGTTL